MRRRIAITQSVHPSRPTDVVSDARRGRVRETRAASGFPAMPPADREWAPERIVRPAPLLLEVREVARLLGVGRTKAYEMVSRKQIPVVRIGRCVRVPLRQLEEWLLVNTAPRSA